MKLPVRLIFCALMLGTPAALAGPREDARATYEEFVAAQNARDIPRVRALLSDSPQFLWVSDGRSVWGREAMLARMASFQEAEVWRVEPSLDKSVGVEIGPDAAYLHLPLTLVIGAAKSPDNIRFLVSMLGVRTPDGWRIAALFTTTAKGD